MYDDRVRDEEAPKRNTVLYGLMLAMLLIAIIIASGMFATKTF